MEPDKTLVVYLEHDLFRHRITNLFDDDKLLDMGESLPRQRGQHLGICMTPFLSKKQSASFSHATMGAISYLDGMDLVVATASFVFFGAANESK